MKRFHFTTLITLALMGSGFPAAHGAEPPSTPTQMVSAEQGAIGKMAALDGVWRGTGWIMDHPGDAPRQLTQTLRAGAFLDGTTRLIEIRGYQADGSLGYHAFNTLYFDVQKGSYMLGARTSGRAGNFGFQATAEGYVWIIGDSTQGLKYTGTIKDGLWTETGESLAPGRPPIKVSEWSVRRVGSTDWPEGGALAAK